MISHVIVDIEGTTSSTWFVHRTLYPYSRERFASYLAAHRTRPDVDAMVQLVRDTVKEPDADDARVVWWLCHWLDGDQKMTALKAFQDFAHKNGITKTQAAELYRFQANAMAAGIKAQQQQAAMAQQQHQAEIAQKLGSVRPDTAAGAELNRMSQQSA